MGKAFQRNFQDYIPLEENDKKGMGKRRRKYVYQGKTFTFQLDKKEFRKLKIKAVFSVLLLFICFLLAMTRRIPANSASIVMVPASLALLALGYLTMGVFSLTTLHLTVPEWEYRPLKRRLETGSQLSRFLLGITVILHLGYSFWVSKTFDWNVGFGALCYALCIVVIWYLRSIWKGIVFTEKEASPAAQASKKEFDEMIDNYKEEGLSIHETEYFRNEEDNGWRPFRRKNRQPGGRPGA